MSETSADVRPCLIVGLGNPGTKYDRTRHNVGFEILDAFARHWQISLTPQKRFQGIAGEGRNPDGDRLILLKPTTYMNHSGRAVRAVMDWYKIPAAEVLVVYDDMDLPIGKLRLRLAGSAGGHNGMKSVIAHVGAQNFARLRVGIGRADHADDRAVISHVLSKFSPTERRQMDAVIAVAVDALDLSLRKGLQPAMNLYNGREIEA